MNYILCIALGLMIGFIAGCAFAAYMHIPNDEDAHWYWSNGYDEGYVDGWEEWQAANRKRDKEENR